jgi:hypothetical protein
MLGRWPQSEQMSDQGRELAHIVGPSETLGSELDWIDRPAMSPAPATSAAPAVVRSWWTAWQSWGHPQASEPDHSSRTAHRARCHPGELGRSRVPAASSEAHDMERCAIPGDVPR